ncbi:MAG: Leucyl-tRNA synthetase, partial [uncultured bacterium]
MSNQYDFKKIENNWKDKWYKDNIYEAVDFSKKPKKYILAELPYPSGKFLHVGHMMRYTVPEIYSRFLRMNGYNVMFPMGWDCFGLPAETFAIKEKITPQEAIAQATVDYKKAMQNMGYAIDWSREINTSDPLYYKWTQWMFIKLWKKGLAEIKEMPVWW